MDHVIDLAARADVPRALAFVNWAIEHTVAHFALAPESLDAWNADFDGHHVSYPWLVARAGRDVIGFARASPHRARAGYAHTAEVSVYVGPEAHGRRVGTALYGVLLPLLRAQGYVTVLAGIVSPHPPSERLHAAAGFVRCGTLHRVGWKHGRWLDVSLWELSLRPDEGPPPDVRAVRDAWAAIRTSPSS